jgi:hypothetical protein
MENPAPAQPWLSSAIGHGGMVFLLHSVWLTLSPNRKKMLQKVLKCKAFPHLSSFTCFYLLLDATLSKEKF